MNDELQSGEADGQDNAGSQAPINQPQSGQIPFDQPVQAQPTNFAQQPNPAGGQPPEQYGNVSPQPLEQPGYGYPTQFEQPADAPQQPPWGSPQQEVPNQWSGNLGVDGQQLAQTQGVSAPGYPAQPGVPPQGVPPQGSPYAPGPMPGQPVAKKKTSAPVIIGIVVAVLVVLALIIVLIVRAGLFGGSDSNNTDDYFEGQAQISDMQTAYSKVSSSISDVYSAAYGQGDIDDEDVADLKEDIKSFEDENAKFGELKVVEDEDVKQSYDAYMAQAEKYVAFTSNLADSAVALSNATQSCTDTPTSSSLDDEFYGQYEEYINACKGDLETLSDAPDPAISKFASAMGEYVGSVSDIIGKMKAIGSYDSLDYGTDQYTQYSDLLDEFYDLGYPSDASTELNDGFDDEKEEADVYDALNDLFDTVEDKIDEILYGDQDD